MPIEIKRNIKRIAEQEFYEIDYQVTGFAFAIHNEYRRGSQRREFGKTQNPFAQSKHRVSIDGDNERHRKFCGEFKQVYSPDEVGRHSMDQLQSS